MAGEREREKEGEQKNRRYRLIEIVKMERQEKESKTCRNWEMIKKKQRTKYFGFWKERGIT